jgi:hypothetical protein
MISWRTMLPGIVLSALVLFLYLLIFVLLAR